MANFIARTALAVAVTAVAHGAAAADSQYGTETKQYIAAQMSYLVVDEDRAISRKGFGASLIYGRQLTDQLWWESEGSGYQLDTGKGGGSDFYQAAVATGLAWAFGDRERFTPFVIGQVGVLRNDVVPSRDDKIGFHANVGIGAVTAPLFKNGLKLRADARYMYDSYDGIRGTASEDQGGFFDWRFGIGVELPLGFRKETQVDKYIYETLEVERYVREPDSDGDGVPDSRDLCPNTLAGGKVDANGCLLKNQVIVFHNIAFELNSDQILATTMPALEKIAVSLNEQTDFRLEIGGHTDSSGSHEYNLDLSERRAEAVRRALVELGVATDRLSSRGYGKTVPLASNDSLSGRAMNRRVEFTVLED